MEEQAMSSETVTFSPYDPADDLVTEEIIAAYIEAAKEEARGDEAYLARVFDDVARARRKNMERKLDMNRRSVRYRARSEDSSPRFTAVSSAV
jgi:probable addiction module antidote protein